jgi:hypothetical protein
MSDISVFPFSRPLVYEQKSEEQQQKYAQEQQMRPSYDRLVVPADSIPVVNTDKPIPGVSDEKTLSAQPQVVEIGKETPKIASKVMKNDVITSKYWPTLIVTALITVGAYMVYTKYVKK